MFGGIASELFEIFYEVGLVEEIVFITDFNKRLCLVQIVENCIETYNCSKFFRRSTNNFPKAFFKRTLTYKQLIIEFSDPDISFALIDKINCFKNEFIGLNLLELRH